MKLADALVEGLIALDVKYVFGVSGANIEHLHDAIHRRGSERLRSIMTKSETGAAFMADGYARVNRTLGVCCATSGGGMVNLVPGIAEAYQSSVPMLALVGQPATGVEGRGAFQDSSGLGRTVNAIRMFNGISKYVRKVDRPEIFWESFMDAVAAALSGRPGPSVLLFPRSIYMSEVGDIPAGLATNILQRIEHSVPSEVVLRQALDELRIARQPVMLIGQGVQRTRNGDAVREFAKAIGVPVVTTMAARGEFPNDDPNYLGILGVAGHPSAHAFVRDKCDVLLLAGCGLNTMTRTPFTRDGMSLPQKRLIAVSIDLGELERVVLEPPRPEASSSAVAERAGARSWWPEAVNSIALGIEADAGVTFAALLALWKEAPFKVRGPGNYVTTTFVPSLAKRSPRVGYALEVDPPEAHSHPLAPLAMIASPPPVDDDPDAPLLQSVALGVLAEHMPSDGFIFFDAGNCAAAALHELAIPPRVTSVIALGMGGMGYAIAGAVGAQMGAARGSQSMVITGDGSYLIAGMEVHTAVDYQLPVLFVVFNNNMHGMCATRQTVFFESRFECVRYAPVDIAKISSGFGDPERLFVARVSTRRELEAALAEYEKRSDRPGVIELFLPVEEVPPFTPFLEREAPTKPARRSILPPSPGDGPRSKR